MKKYHFAVQMKGKEMKQKKNLSKLCIFKCLFKNRIFHSKFHLKNKMNNQSEIPFNFQHKKNKVKSTKETFSQHKTLL